MNQLPSFPSFATIRRFVKKYLFICAVLVLIALLTTLYSLGYRPGPGLTIVRVGTVLVASLPSGATVYVDGSKRGVTHSGFMRLSEVPGSHLVIVDAVGNYPWNEVVTVSSRTLETVTPVLVPVDLVQTPVESEKKNTALAILHGDWFPTSDSPLHLNCMDIYVDANRVLARVSSSTAPASCTPPAFLCSNGTCAPTIIFAPVDKVTSVIPFPGRTDTLVIAFGSTMAAIEIDPRSPQFFAPLIHGNVPFQIAPASSGRILVSAGGAPVYLNLQADAALTPKK